MPLRLKLAHPCRQKRHSELSESNQSVEALPRCLEWRPAVDVEVLFGTSGSYPRIVREVA
jgi:hypothetical protein